MYRRMVLGLAGFALALLLPGCIGLDFSPDGKQLAVTWNDELALIHTDGTGFQSVPEGGKGYTPAWAPDGKHILFIRNEDKDSALMLYDIAQNKTRKIGDKYEPPLAWREDGQQFVALHKTEKDEREVVRYNLREDRVELRVRLPFPSVAGLNIVWLPDTDNLALIGQDGDRSNVYTVEAGRVKQITETDDVIGLALSGDRKRLVWARKSPDLRYALMSLYTYDLTNRNVDRLPFPDRIPLLNPDLRHAPKEIQYLTFSPDGTRLALTARFKADPDPKTVDTKPMMPETEETLEYSACYVLRMDGSDTQQIGKTLPSPNGGGFILPAWSHNGHRIATLRLDDERQILGLFKADGKEAKTLLTAPQK